MPRPISWRPSVLRCSAITAFTPAQAIFSVEIRASGSGRSRIQATSRAAVTGSSIRGGRSPTPARTLASMSLPGTPKSSAPGSSSLTTPARTRPAVPSVSVSSGRYSSPSPAPVQISQTCGIGARAAIASSDAGMSIAGAKPTVSATRRLSSPPPRVLRTAATFAASGVGASSATHRHLSRAWATKSRPAGSAAPSTKTGVVT